MVFLSIFAILFIIFFIWALIKKGNEPISAVGLGLSWICLMLFLHKELVGPLGSISDILFKTSEQNSHFNWLSLLIIGGMFVGFFLMYVIFEKIINKKN